MNDARTEYEKKLLERNAKANAPEVPVEAAPSLQAAGEKMGSSMATQSAQQGDLAGTIGGAAMMTGNPYAMAAGLGLQVLASGEQNKRAAEERQRVEYNERIARRQQMMQQIANSGIQ